jgi:exodeoxyribonuclease-3
MHPRQLFIDRVNVKEFQETRKPETMVINWNVSNPSLSRAIKQVRWLTETNSDVVVLTETKFSKGCVHIKDRLESLGYHVVLPKSKTGGYGVLVASKLWLRETNFTKYIDRDLRTRVISVRLPFLAAELEIIAIYVPNKRDDKKKKFLQSLLCTLEASPPTSYRIFCGDFNVLEPDHIPFYPKFESWEYKFYSSLSKYQLKDAFRYLNPETQEYSWIGRTGDGYRYDHFFVSRELLPLVKECSYIHKPRKLRLSDHSTMYMKISSFGKTEALELVPSRALN